MLKNQRLEGTVDPDETAHYEPSHLDLQCLQIQLLLCLALYGLAQLKIHIMLDVFKIIICFECCIALIFNFNIRSEAVV